MLTPDNDNTTLATTATTRLRAEDRASHDRRPGRRPVLWRAPGVAVLTAADPADAEAESEGVTTRFDARAGER
jgi:hypothetical protein